jgi:hypothetical protein
MVRMLRERKDKNSKSELVKKIDFTTPEALAEQKKLDGEIEEANRLAREKAELEAEKERKRQEKEAVDYRKIMQNINRKKFEDNPPPFPLSGYHDGDTPKGYKPSRMIDVESDVAIMNIEMMVTSIKESVDFIENKLWEIEDYLYRHDKKKRESLKLKKMKRQAKKR